MYRPVPSCDIFQVVRTGTYYIIVQVGTGRYVPVRTDMYQVYRIPDDPSMLYHGKLNNGIYLVYTWYMHCICQTYSSIWIDWFITAKETTQLPSRNRTRMYRSLQMLGTWFPSSKRIFYSAWMSDRYIPGVYQVYIYHITYAAILQAFLVSQARLDVSDLDFLRILSVFATESPPTLGWGLPKFHSQSLIS